MSASQWLRVPLGPDGPQWRTLPIERSVLTVVHTVTAANRLADILTVFDSDRRVQLIYSCPGASAVTNGVDDHLASTGALIMPWDQAISTKFDLALSVHNSGKLHEINAPLAILSHGLGYTKYSNQEPRSPGAQEPRSPGAQEPRSRSVYGLSREWLTHDGAVTPQAIVLSHEEQYARLAGAAPEALDSTVIAGDPCLDRMAVSYPYRRSYREALGADANTTVIVVSSTWGPDSLLGRNPDLIAQLLAELPADRYVVAAVLHPNAWFAHGPAQIRLWLADCLRAGLRLVPPAEGWQQAVLAADVVIGDHGAVTAYAACAGRATLLASFPEHQVAPGSAVSALGHTARRLDRRAPFAEQLDAAIKALDPFDEVRELASSMPGQAAGALRSLFYELMALPEPARAPLVPPYASSALRPERSRVAAWWVATDTHNEREVSVTRWPADVDARLGSSPVPHDQHLVVEHGHPRQDLAGNAAILLVDRHHDAAAILAERPASMLAVSGDRLLYRDGSTALMELSATDEDAIIACTSAIYTLLAIHQDWHSLPEEIIVHLGSRRLSATITDRSND